MTYLSRIPLLLVLLSCATTAQTNTGSTNVESSLQIGTRTDEERVQFLLEVAQAYYNEDDFQSAISAYERALEIDPKNREARYVIGHVYISGKQYVKAEKILTGLVAENPGDFKLLNNLAWLYATAEDPSFRDGQKALELAQKAMVLAPNDHHVWSTLAEAYYVIGQYEKAYRAITHMAQLAAKYGTNITEEMVEGYNEQIRKCKRAMDLQKALEEDEGKNQPAEEASIDKNPEQ